MEVTLRVVAFVAGVPFVLCSFIVIQEEHIIIPLTTPGLICSLGVCSTARNVFSNYVEAARVGEA